MNKTTENIVRQCDVAVIGGGMAGLCAAISAAKLGVDTVLVQDRPVLGGNASSEVRMHICGASCHGHRENARETGIIEEILLENKHRNPTHSYGMFDTLLWEKANFQENLELYLNTHMYDVVMSGNKISSVIANQLTTEKTFEFSAKIFIDCTGDGLLAYSAGAEFMFGREAKSQFSEPNAVEISDSITMGNTVQWSASDAGMPVPFERPVWAHNYRDSKWAEEIKIVESETSGTWWMEIGGTELNIIKDSEKLRDELLKIIFGYWDYRKNCYKKKSENLVLDWVGFIPAKRESRRVVGDYVLKEQDLLESKQFDDAIAYGGWHIDMHQAEKFYAFISGDEQNEDKSIHLTDIYSIPYRCIYSKNIDNLMLSGRIISATHRAFASTRVMGTCAVLGQAAGIAAGMAVKSNLLPRDMGGNINDLQQQLLKEDCYIPGIVNNDKQDFARSASVSCSSQTAEGDCSNVINGISRPTKQSCNMWESADLKNPQWINLDLGQVHNVNEIRLTFDSNLSIEIMQSMSNWAQEKQSCYTPDTIVKDYTIELYNNNELVFKNNITNNYQRHNVIKFENSVSCTNIKITITATNGCVKAKILEIRAY